MFDDPRFEKYGVEEIQLNRDVYLMDQIWMKEYERSLMRLFDGAEYENIGDVAPAAVRKIRQSVVELSWYPNTYDRFHEVLISLPRDQIVTCVGCDDYDETHRIFVKSAWLENLYRRSYSVFALVDAVGVKEALRTGQLTKKKLLLLRDKIDALSERYNDISFISFADSLLLKSNWSVGMYESDVQYNYQPEKFIHLIADIESIYRSVLGLNVYAVLTQGSNEYYDEPLLHISATQNHVSLNSLGLPFAQLMSIDEAVRDAIRGEVHGPAELYMDQNLFYSLKFVPEFKKKSCSKNTYRAPLMEQDGTYYFAGRQKILDNLRS